MGDLGARLTTRVTGVIVAGGSATRLGGVAKGLLEVGGVRIIDRVAAALAPVVDDIVVSANAPDAGAWRPGARVISDVLREGGAASGIHATLRASGGPVLAVGWDMPFITPELLRLIIATADQGCDAVVPSGRPPHTLEPLCAWYAPAVAVAIESGWGSGRRSLHELLRSLNTCIVPADAVATIGDAERLFFNVNTPEDLATARALAEGE